LWMFVSLYNCEQVSWIFGASPYICMYIYMYVRLGVYTYKYTCICMNVHVCVHFFFFTTVHKSPRYSESCHVHSCILYANIRVRCTFKWICIHMGHIYMAYKYCVYTYTPIQTNPNYSEPYAHIHIIWTHTCTEYIQIDINIWHMYSAYIHLHL